MRSRLPLLIASLALVVALTGTPFVQAGASAVRRALFASNAGAVNGVKASKTPKPGRLLPLGRDGRFPASVLPSGAAGRQGAAGAQGLQGPKGETGPAGPPATAASIADGSITPAKLAVVPSARVTANGLQQAPEDGSSAVASWNTEQFDTASLWAPADPTRLTAPIPGIYLITAGAIREAAAPVIPTLSILVNGSAQYASDVASPSASGFNVQTQSISTIAPLDAGDYAEMLFAGQDIDGFFNNKRTHLSMTWLSALPD